MAEMAILIDVAKCTACRACQVACKSWNQLKAEKTQNQGSHENPPDLSAVTWNRIKYSEVTKDEKLRWLFLNERCRHCAEPPCMGAAMDVPNAIVKDPTGAVVYTDETKKLSFQDTKDTCPYNIPRRDEKSGRIVKCTLCIDRITNGMKPACVKTCPTGTLSFGEKAEMVKRANERVKALGGDATLYPGEEYNVLWVLPEPMESYGLVVMAPEGTSRRTALAKMFAPLGTIGLAVAGLGIMRSDSECVAKQKDK
jgi:formate dehydrogenase iron-sulfur subunit